jgi:hypothetical protein
MPIHTNRSIYYRYINDHAPSSSPHHYVPKPKGSCMLLFNDPNNATKISNNDLTEKITFHALINTSIFGSIVQRTKVTACESLVKYIIPKGSSLTDEELRRNVTWSTCLNVQHKKFMSDYTRDTSGDKDRWVLCIGYGSEGIYDIQLGLTGTCDEGESVEDCIRRESFEECNVRCPKHSVYKLNDWNIKNKMWTLEAFLID